MNEKDKKVIKKLFSGYYGGYKLTIPSDLEKREFGIIPLDSGVMVRHLSFETEESLLKFIKRNIPLHLYYSSALYESPSVKNMSEKGWLGAELIFDIDADHIETPCKKRHDFWICNNCGFRGTGKMPEKCPKCGSTEIKEEKWICRECLNAAKKEAFRLIDDFLIPDFGFSKKDLQIVFSGQRGYHVHVDKKSVFKLDQFGRREIANYIMGQGFAPEYHGFIKGKQGFVAPSLYEKGWRGKAIKATIIFLKKANNPDYFKHVPGVSAGTAKKLFENKKVILETLSSESVHLSAVKNIKSQVIYNLITTAIKDFGCKIDAPVTGDIKRLIRMPESLHGKTGFVVKPLSYNELEPFDPFRDAIVFKKGTLLITLTEDAQELVINNEVYGPFKKGEKVEAPTAVAVFLILQKKATIGSE